MHVYMYCRGTESQKIPLLTQCHFKKCSEKKKDVHVDSDLSCDLHQWDKPLIHARDRSSGGIRSVCLWQDSIHAGSREEDGWHLNIKKKCYCAKLNSWIMYQVPCHYGLGCVPYRFGGSCWFGNVAVRYISCLILSHPSGGSQSVHSWQQIVVWVNTMYSMPVCVHGMLLSAVSLCA